MNKMNQIFLIVSFSMIIGVCSIPSVIAGYDRSNEVNQYMAMLESTSLTTRIDAAKQISRSGLTDLKLFNYIKDELLRKYALNPNNADHIDEMAWLCKALAASGNSEYIPVLKTVVSTTTSDKLKRYAKQSIDLVSVYAVRSQTMANENQLYPNFSPEMNRYINMLRSDDFGMKREAAKTIYRNHYTEEKLFDVIRDELLKGYSQISGNSKQDVDALAWMCKALASSGMTKYRSDLTHIIDHTSNPKLKKYAKQSRAMLK